PAPPATSALSLHDALPICLCGGVGRHACTVSARERSSGSEVADGAAACTKHRQKRPGCNVCGGKVDGEHLLPQIGLAERNLAAQDRKSTRLNSSHVKISYA